ncbi:MAG: winged helix-turn-helix transcriptional regulator [Lentisphaeria bacterium]|nr:winged helix-turn-helix transcriptional regulator [Lentisphaeria bacterium]
MNSDGDCERGTFQVDVSVFKKMVRMLELKRRQFFESDWKNCSRIIPRAQFNHLMLVRFSMPCNLGTIMGITGLTSAGASLFVDKLVNAGVLKREEDPDDRRNIVISVTDEGQKFLKEIDDRLDDFIYSYFAECTDDELKIIDGAMRIVCSKVDAE